MVIIEKFKKFRDDINEYESKALVFYGNIFNISSLIALYLFIAVFAGLPHNHYIASVAGLLMGVSISGFIRLLYKYYK